MGIYLTCLCAFAESVMAWDGFDAATADLVEITPDRIPRKGETVQVRFYEGDKNKVCTVESVTRNTMTIEVMVREPDGSTRILVMESR